MKKYELIEFPYFSDIRGDLIPFEFNDKFPFLVKRTYLVTANTNQTRGGHSHIIEDEIFVAVTGSITTLVNDGTEDKIIKLDQKNKALLVKKQCWHEFYNFSPDAVMMCFSSTHYLPGNQNYIMDKKEFLKSIA